MNLISLEAENLTYTTTSNQLRDAIHRISESFFAKGEADRDAIKSQAELLQRQDAVRSFLIESMGGLPQSDAPLNPVITGTVLGEGFSIEKVVFESRPRHYVTANLYLPEGRQGATPAVLFLCGHSINGKAAPKYQVVCQLLAKAGLIVLAQDPVGQGERLSYYDNELKMPRVPPCTRDHDYAGIPCRLVGDTIARYFLHDAMRSLDYLASRPEVDASRLGVTGNSGGGTQSCLLMATDARIKAAAPGTFVMSRQSYLYTGQAQDAEQVWPGYTAAGFDHEDLLLAVAPKPLAVLAVKSDFFPIEGTRRSVNRVRRFWEMHGCPANIDLVEDADVHGYSLNLAQASARFFAKHLLGRNLDTSSWSGSPFPESEIQCLASGQVSAEFPDAEFVFHANAARVHELAAARAAIPLKERRQRALDWLKEQVFGPRRTLSPEISPRLIQRGLPCEGFDVDYAYWYTLPYLTNTAYLFRNPADRGKTKGVTIALWAEGSRRVTEHFEWIASELAMGRAVLLLNLSGMGQLAPPPGPHGPGLYGFYETFYKLDDELIWNGDSMVALRTWEVTRAIDALQELAPLWSDLDLGNIRLYGHGREGLYARLAAAIEPRAKECTWDGAFTWSALATSRYYNTCNIKLQLLPKALRYFDLDEI